jgi:hypothetical protein
MMAGSENSGSNTNLKSNGTEKLKKYLLCDQKSRLPSECCEYGHEPSGFGTTELVSYMNMVPQLFVEMFSATEP